MQINVNAFVYAVEVFFFFFFATVIGLHETRNISDRNRRFGGSCAIIKVTKINAVCEKAKFKRICIKECQANYMNTLANSFQLSLFTNRILSL